MKKKKTTCIRAGDGSVRKPTKVGSGFGSAPRCRYDMEQTSPIIPFTCLSIIDFPSCCCARFTTSSRTLNECANRRVLPQMCTSKCNPVHACNSTSVFVLQSVGETITCANFGGNKKNNYLTVTARFPITRIYLTFISGARRRGVPI